MDRIKAVLFDLDGTLTDTLEDIAAAMNRALRMAGLTEWETEAYKYLVGNGVRILAERAVKGHSELTDRVQREYQQWYEVHNTEHTAPYAGIPGLLRSLKERGLKICVLSNKPDADTKNVVSRYFPEIMFDAVQGQVPGVPVKPDPAGALKMAETLGIEPRSFAYVGDTAVDMSCAVAAGMHPFGALWGFRTAGELTGSGAEMLLKAPEELLRCL